MVKHKYPPPPNTFMSKTYVVVDIDDIVDIVSILVLWSVLDDLFNILKTYVVVDINDFVSDHSTDIDDIVDIDKVERLVHNWCIV